MSLMSETDVKKNDRINLELPAELKAQIEKKAEEHMLTTSAYVRIVLAEKIKKESLQSATASNFSNEKPARD